MSQIKISLNGCNSRIKKTEKKINEHKDVLITLPKLKNTEAKVEG